MPQRFWRVRPEPTRRVDRTAPRSFLLQPIPIHERRDWWLEPELLASVRIQVNHATRCNVSDVAVDMFLSVENANHSKCAEARHRGGKCNAWASPFNRAVSPRADTVVTNRQS